MTVINTNVGALMARTYAARANNTMTRSMERLSSGQRINSAADDAAGLAVANKMESQSRGIKMAMRNSKDGISLVQTAESGMSQISNMILRMRELAVQMDNGVYTTTDRDNAQLEINALLAEIDKIAANTRFNDVALLDGSYDQTIRSGNTNAETTRISLNSMFVKDTGASGSIIRRDYEGPIATTAADFNTNFANSLAAQLGISATSYSSLTSTDSEAMLSDLVSSNSFKQGHGGNVLLLKDKLQSVGYQYATVTVTDDQWSQVSANLEKTKTLYEEVASLDALETTRRGQISDRIEALEKERSQYIGSLFHADEIEFKSHSSGNLTNDKFAEIVNVYSDTETRQSVSGQIAAIEVEMFDVAKNLHNPRLCAHCLAQANDGSSGSLGPSGSSAVSGGEVTSDGEIRNAIITDKDSSGSGLNIPAAGSGGFSSLIMGRQWTNVGSDATPHGGAADDANGNLSYSYWDGTDDTATYSYTEGTRTSMAAADAGNIAVHDKVMVAWDDAAPFTLSKVVENSATGATNIGDIRIAFSDAVPSGSAAYAYGPNSTAKGGDVYYGTTQMNVAGVDFVKGEYSYLTALHEIGHALGLSHPFDGGSVDDSTMNLNLDRQRNTVMTYTQTDRNVKIKLDGGGNAAIGAKVHITTPGLLDIEAIEHIYGNTGWESHTGDTIYGAGEGGTEEIFDNNYEQIRVISDSADAGGGDTIDASSVTADAYGRHSIIDLTPGTYSSINTYTTDADKISAVAGGDAAKIASFNSLLATQDAHASAGNSYYPDFTRTALYRGQENLGIAHNTWIENAKGGGGNDIITGNNKGNELTGNGGNDTIDGSGGVDMAIYDEAYTNYAVSNASGTVTVSHTGGSADEGIDTLTNIEFLKFSDGIYTVATSTFAAGAADPTLSGTETGGKTGGVANGESALNENNMLLKDIGVKTQAEAQAAITVLNRSLEQIATGRAQLGAVSNRLSHNLDNQTQASMMTQQARGRVVDTDMAIESTKLAQEQILSQAAQQAINMATQRQQTVLMLLDS
ncbi:flagellin [Alphaproteobacteria bacterium]|nr:flagellin [Alphaproteobacteria bacterium]